MTSSPTKHDLMKWADARHEIDLQSKVILQKFAAFAQEDGDTWSKVETLAQAANCSIRTVQNRLAALREAGYLRDTGRQHRLKGSTRSVPLYVLKPTFEAEEIDETMGAAGCTHTDAWVQDPAAMGAAVCTRKDTQDPSESSDELSTRARALRDGFEAVEKAYPRAGLGYTDRAMARRAFDDLVGSGVPIDGLVAAAAAYAADPVLKRRDYGPVGLQRWLGEGRYRAWLPVDPTTPAAAPGAPIAAGAVELPAELAGLLTAEQRASYLVGWREADRVLLTRTETGALNLARAIGRQKLAELQITIERARVAQGGEHG